MPSFRFRFNRIWLSSAAVSLGLLAGCLIGRESILSATNSRMEDYADRLIQREEAISKEVISAVNAANASPYAPCSDEDIVLLRRLTFSARFLKDVGRLRQSDLICSASIGKLKTPVPLVSPDITLPSGAKIYKNYPLPVPRGDYAEIAASRNAAAVVSPDGFSDFPQRPIRYSTGVVGYAASNPSQKTILAGIANVGTVPPGVIESTRMVCSGDILYRSRCSQTVPICTVTQIPLSDVWSGNRALFFLYAMSGGAAGIACAAALLMVGRKRHSHTNQLKRAILTGKLSVVYQPIIELGSQRIVGAEALARWTDEDGDSIRPETIIALAEAEGFVSDITRFVLTHTIEEIRPVFEADPRFRVHLNLAPSDLADPRLLLLLDEKLSDATVTPDNLAFEFPERAVSDRDIVAAAVRRLRDRGHAVFIDDFGTGYSNLAHLAELKVDGIKINRSFIATIGTQAVTASIIPQILALAKSLDLKVVVQGIERQDQASYFSSEIPEMLGQGWFFGQPVPAKGLIYLCAEKSE